MSGKGVVVENILTDHLGKLFPEDSPMTFYRLLFPEGCLASNSAEKNKYNGILMRLLPRSDGGGMNGEPHLIFNDLENVELVLSLDSALPGVVDLVSPISYAGRSPRMDRAHELFALVFDLDGVKIKEDGSPQGLIDLLYWMAEVEGVRGPLLPTPTYIVSSGTGLHLYYFLKKPIRLWPNVCEQLRFFRNAFTRKLWNPYVTDLSDKPQLEAVVQSFRMVGSKSKDGKQIVRAFRTGGRISIETMNTFVPDEAKVPDGVLGTGCSLDEARKKWPDWDPAWREKKAAVPDRPWKIKRALYDWWCARVESDETLQGNRYWAIFVASCYAAKCGVPFEELEEWAMRVRPFLDAKTVDDDNHFTVQHVYDALRAYSNPRSVMIRRDKIEEKTGMKMRDDVKRNGRKQALHLKLARANLKVLNEEEGRARQGRPKGSPNKAHPKRDAIRAYALEHPDASHSAIARALGVSRPTVIKWLKPSSNDSAEAVSEWTRAKNAAEAMIAEMDTDDPIYEYAVITLDVLGLGKDDMDD